MDTPLLSIKGLRVQYPSGSRRTKVDVLHGVDLDIRPGETLGLVGESGSGKTTIGRAILGLVPASSGRIEFDRVDLAQLSPRERRQRAADVQVIFQDPYSSLNPAMTIAEILSEPLVAARTGKTESLERVRSLLDRVGLPSDSMSRYPNEFSGGQRQRIAIARALALSPRLIICDEPVSALDLTTQARVLDLLREIQDSTGVAYLFVTHDLTVVRHISHRVAVMRKGEIVETASAAEVTSHPQHTYTRRLLLAAPVPDPSLQRERRRQRRALPAATESLSTSPTVGA